MGNHLDNKGFTLMEVLVSLGITALATISLLSILQMYYSATNRSNTRSAVMDTELDAYFIQENLAEWLENTTDPTKPTFYSAPLANCFRTPSATCPAALDAATINSIRDAELNSYISLGKTIATVPIKNMQGQQIAGTVTAPLYYSSGGQQVTAAAQAAYSVAGVMVRDNATGAPGKVVLLLRVAAQTGTATGGTPMKTRWVRVNVGTRWEFMSAEIFGSCTSGQYVKGVDPSTGSVICESYQFTCAANQYVYGLNSNGTPMCSDMPPTVSLSPSSAPNVVACDSFGYSSTSCTVPGGRTISGVTVNERRSRAGCSIGSDVTFSGSTIYVSGGCRATFNVYYQ